jgi:hypothetical protein
MLNITLERPIVLFDVNTILAASIRNHQNYKESKEMLNALSSTSQGHTRLTGIITPTVKSQAEHTLKKALHDTLQNNFDNRHLDQLYPLIKHENFLRLLNTLKPYQIPHNVVQKIKEEEITPMYDEILKRKIGKPIISLCSSWKLRSTVRNIKKERKGALKSHLKRKSIIPDATDKMILSEAVYLKREEFQANEMYLVSWDKHFSGNNGFYKDIPERIKKTFGINCVTPKLLLYELKHSRINN